MMGCSERIDWELILNPKKKRKKRGCHSNHFCWKHFYENNKKNSFSDRQNQARINIRHKELVDEGYKPGDAVYMAVKEVVWDAN